MKRVYARYNGEVEWLWMIGIVLMDGGESLSLSLSLSLLSLSLSLSLSPSPTHKD